MLPGREANVCRQTPLSIAGNGFGNSRGIFQMHFCEKVLFISINIDENDIKIIEKYKNYISVRLSLLKRCLFDTFAVKHLSNAHK